MSINSEIQLRDFDEESDETDSETELLIRRSVGRMNRYQYLEPTTTTSTTRAGGAADRARERTTKHATLGAKSFFSQLFGRSNTKATATATATQVRATSGSNSLGRVAAGQVRYRNENSRERAQFVGTTNTNNANTIAFQKTPSSQNTIKLAQSGATLDEGPTVSASASGSGSGASGSGGGSGALQTIVDPENGSTTVFYQNNRRRSKSRTFGNLCKNCLCG